MSIFLVPYSLSDVQLRPGVRLSIRTRFVLVVVSLSEISNRFPESIRTQEKGFVVRTKSLQLASSE